MRRYRRRAKNVRVNCADVIVVGRPAERGVGAGLAQTITAEGVELERAGGTERESGVEEERLLDHVGIAIAPDVALHRGLAGIEAEVRRDRRHETRAECAGVGDQSAGRGVDAELELAGVGQSAVGGVAVAVVERAVKIAAVAELHAR